MTSRQACYYFQSTLKGRIHNCALPAQIIPAAITTDRASETCIQNSFPDQLQKILITPYVTFQDPAHSEHFLIIALHLFLAGAGSGFLIGAIPADKIRCSHKPDHLLRSFFKRPEHLSHVIRKIRAVSLPLIELEAHPMVRPQPFPSLL